MDTRNFRNLSSILDEKFIKEKELINRILH